nr:SPFH domain-containing protein [Commensalibacter communis]
MERLGKYKTTLGTSLNILTPFVDRVAHRLSTKDQILNVPSQDAITKDNVLVKVNAICFIKIIDTQKAAYGVENYEQATISLVMTSLCATIGKMDLDESLSSSESMQVAMEQQAAAERHRKAAETQAAGNKQATVLEAEGIRQSTILKAEGIKQSTILKAEAEQEAAVRQAAAAVSLAEGTKRSNELLAEGIEAVDGQSALNYQLSKQYIEALALLFKSESNKVLIMPPELSQSMGNLINSSFVLGATNELDEKDKS